MTKDHASGVGGNTDRLHSLMKEHGLSAERVASITGRAVKTVYGWRVGNPHAIPTPILRLLELELRDSERGGRKSGA